VLRAVERRPALAVTLVERASLGIGEDLGTAVLRLHAVDLNAGLGGGRDAEVGLLASAANAGEARHAVSARSAGFPALAGAHLIAGVGLGVGLTYVVDAHEPKHAVDASSARLARLAAHDELSDFRASIEIGGARRGARVVEALEARRAFLVVLAR